MNEITRGMIVDEARKWLGTPFHHQGRVIVPEGGVDCIGLLVAPARALGVAIEDRTDYSLQPDGTLVPELEAQFDQIETSEMRPGDLAALWFVKRSVPQHVGILTDYKPVKGFLGLLHTYQDVGKVSEHALTDWWRSRLHSAWRYRGVVA